MIYLISHPYYLDYIYMSSSSLFLIIIERRSCRLLDGSSPMLCRRHFTLRVSFPNFVHANHSSPYHCIRNPLDWSRSDLSVFLNERVLRCRQNSQPFGSQPGTRWPHQPWWTYVACGRGHIAINHALDWFRGSDHEAIASLPIGIAPCPFRINYTDARTVLVTLNCRGKRRHSFQVAHHWYQTKLSVCVLETLLV